MTISSQEILSNVNVLLSEKNNVRLIAAHRTVLEDGTQQNIANSHCFSCHLTSQEEQVKSQLHELEAGLQAEVSDVTVGYQFGYRHFESEAPVVEAYYDPAKHPVNGGSGAEFSSRQVFDDTSAAVGAPPKTEKMSHKLRLKTDLGKGRVAGSAGYFRTENKNTSLVSDGWTGALNYSVVLSPRTRFVAKAAGTRLWNDNAEVDLPDYRAGRPGIETDYTQTDFDFTRYSSLDRRTMDASAEVIHRLNPKLTVSGLIGFNQVKRYYYPHPDDYGTSDKIIAQFKARYRKGLTYSTQVKYRFEKTSDPFTSDRGLFEAVGRDELHPGVNLPAAPYYFFFYYQREDIRYQNITTVPTDYHEFEFRTTYKPDPKVNVNLGLKAIYDKNGDLDSLDVNHLMFRPHLNLTLMPSTRATVTAGYTYNHSKSRGPVSVALFDG